MPLRRLVGQFPSNATCARAREYAIDCYDFESITARDGLSEALAERAMQFDTLSLQREYIEASGIEADLRLGGYFVGWLSQQDVGRGEAAHAFCELHREQCADPYCGLNEALNAEEARERTRSPRMEGALFQPSGGSVWSARIAFGLLEEAIAAGVTLRTQTRVLAVEPAGATQAEEGGDADGGGRYGQWSVRTDKGTVRARHVVYATNAYSSTLLPEFRGVINPYRNQVVVTTPAPALSDAMFWLSSPSAGSSYAYIVQRADGRLVIGANAAPGDHLDDSVASISEQVTERMLAELRETWPALADVEAEQVHMGVTLWTVSRLFRTACCRGCLAACCVLRLCNLSQCGGCPPPPCRPMASRGSAHYPRSPATSLRRASRRATSNASVLGMPSRRCDWLSCDWLSCDWLSCDWLSCD
eukprot:COSAG01_NODE_1488_length_10130_cov_17.546388_4_plen_417_part_00